MGVPTTPEGLPLDDRSNALKIPIITLIIFSSVFVLLRLGINWRNRNFFLLTDHLLWTGQVIAVAGAACCYRMAEVGGGRHIWDPMLTPRNLETYLYYLWLGQLLNLYGMALVKLSVCAYIFMLDFSRTFRIIIWASVVIHILVNVVFPTVILFGECTPYTKHWDVAGTKPGSCWSATPRVISGYSGAAVNILTDLLYTMSPLIYIARVQLPKRTIWGVRAVFLCGLITTTISAMKLYEMKSLNESPDPTYSSVNLSVFAIAEVFVGVFTACLPPLRKTFENLLRKVLPTSITGGSGKGSRQSYALQNTGPQMSGKSSKRKHDTDDDSELGILPDGEVVSERKGSDQPITIMKTTHVEVTADSKSIASRRHGDWPNPHHLDLGATSFINMSKPSKPYHRDLQFRGFVEGLTYIDSDSQAQCHYFGGVPYALPPVGPFRFHKPRSLPPCYRYGTKANPGRYTGACGLCPQPGSSTEVLNEPAWDEDCLQTNIWIPAGQSPAEGWPVLFWIHGGFLQWGSPNGLDLRALFSESPTQCVVVSPAYRLNVFGFLASQDLVDSCPDFGVNLGFWDQRMALQWTYENISYFGGNASNITIGGYSAGSHSVFHQLSYDLGLPDEKTVVKRALMLSNGPGMQPKSLTEAQDQFDELLKALNIESDASPAEKLARLRAISPRQIVEASNKIKHHQFRAVTDGSFVRHGLLEELSNGVYAKRMKRRNVKLIIGECSDEHFVYGLWRPPKPGYENMLHRLEADYPREACKVLMSHYFPNRKLPSKYTSWQAVFGHIYADVQIHALRRGMVNALVKHGAGDLIHRYRIEWRAQCVDKELPEHFGASHGSDMAIWFWGNGNDLSEGEKNIALKTFHEPLSRFLKGEKMEWGTQHAMQLRTLKSDGNIVIEEDTRLDEGLKLWNALKTVGATGSPKDMAKL
ncbi:alpha beta-hydrolase [Alternaria burnsii]|uniref:Alpha beta-hydrolase n=1 Tax=Alternaria burnsii TaxID=1187904 RepID=A0A8H7EL44_9PLEO|nr:alpha beta-hydrolase [Alternaria burnsii]KAF7679772.1 alpha beta-hydrolase [Alternaria burnsii]